MILNEIQVDYSHNVITIKGENIYFKPREMEIFNLLFAQKGRPLPMDNIISNIYILDEPVYANESIRVHVHHINKKINPKGFQVYPISGRGYKLADINEVRYRYPGRPRKNNS